MFVLLSTLLLAQQPAVAPPDDAVRLTLKPAAAPTPSLRYRLLPEPNDQPGNAAVLYSRTYAFIQDYKELKNRFSYDFYTKPDGTEVDRVEEWLGMPIKGFPVKEVNEYLAPFRVALREFDHAGRLRHCDWSLAGRQEGFFLIQPECQLLRRWASILALKARLEMAQGKPEEAVRTLQAGFALGRNVSQGSNCINYYIGVACCKVMLRQTEALLEIAPEINLYWALTMLPLPDMEPAVREDRRMIVLMFPELLDLEKGTWTPRQVAALEQRLRDVQKNLGLDVERAEVRRAIAVAGAAPIARTELMARGMPRDEVELLPDLQVALLWAFREEQRAWLEMEKWRHVPWPQAIAHWPDAMNTHDQAVAKLDLILLNGVWKMFGYSGVASVKLAGLKLQRHIALLCTIEAVRAHAAAHQGKLPEQLGQVTGLPVPLDPLTGKEFLYKVEGGKATLEAPSMPNENISFNVGRMRYEVTLGK